MSSSRRVARPAARLRAVRRPIRGLHRRLHTRAPTLFSVALTLAGFGAVAIAGCDASAVPATPAITPGIAGAPRQVNVILKDYEVVPGLVDLVPGETITLNVVNGGLDIHELVLGPAAVQQAWEDAEGPAANPPPGPTPAVSVPPGLAGLRVVVASGATKSVTYTVPADVTEPLLLGCHISDHWERGMAGAVRLVGPGGVPLDGASPARS